MEARREFYGGDGEGNVDDVPGVRFVPLDRWSSDDSDAGSNRGAWTVLSEDGRSEGTLEEKRVGREGEGEEPELGIGKRGSTGEAGVGPGHGCGSAAAAWNFTFMSLKDYRRFSWERMGGDGEGGTVPFDLLEPGEKTAYVTLRAAVIVAYVAVSAAMIFGNVYFMRGLGFHFPWTLTAIQALLGLGFAWAYFSLASLFRGGVRRRAASMRTHGLLICTTALFFSLNIGFNNASLGCVSAAVNQDIRSLNAVFTAVFAWFFLGKGQRPVAWLLIALVAAGAAMGVYGATDSRSECFLDGVVLALVSSASTGLMMVCVEPMLRRSDEMRLDPVSLCLYTSVPIFLCCGTLALWGEFEGFRAYAAARPVETLLVSVAASAGAFLLNLLQYELISLTDAVYSSVVGNVKTAVVFAAAGIVAWARPGAEGGIHGDPLSLVNWIGIAVVLLGFFALTYVHHCCPAPERETKRAGGG